MKSTRTNIKEFIEDPKNQGDLKFPSGFTMEMFELMTEAKQKSTILKIIGTNGRHIPKWRTIFDIPVTKKALRDGKNFKFTQAVFNYLVKIRNEQLDTVRKYTVPLISWNEIDDRMQDNFKSWLKIHATKYDDNFTVDLFNKLQDDIKVEFYFTVARKFGIDNYEDLKNFKVNDVVFQSKAKRVAVSKEILDAIDDVIPIKNSDGLSKEEIEIAREERKVAKRKNKLLATARRAGSLIQYEKLLTDPLFDREMLESIFKRMENENAFTGYKDPKMILKMIAEHPLTTTEDLIRIRKMKRKRSAGWGGGQTLYNSSYLNSALANKSDLPKDELMLLVRKSQFDPKLVAAKRDDLDKKELDELILYTIRHHCHMPNQVKQIFEALGKTKQLESKYQKTIIDTLKGKYKRSTWTTKPAGLKFLQVVDEYGWLNDLSDMTKQEMGDVIYMSYRANNLTKERILDIMDRLQGDSTYFLTRMYEETKDASFLPKEARDIFLF